MKLLIAILIAAFVVSMTPLDAEARTYENDKYSFEYPTGCKLEKKENRFSSADASMECKGDAGFLFESGDESSLLWSILSDDQMVSNLEETLGNIHYGSDVIERGTDKYTINNQTAPYVIGTYDQEFHNLFGTTKTEEWALMIMLIKLPNGEHVLVQYRNNEDSFDKQLPMAEKIFKSVKQVGNWTIAETETEADNSFTRRGDNFSKTSALCDTVTTQSAKDLCETLLS
jgi:hypothetical protein